MTESTTPSGNNALLREATPVRKIGRLERFLGPENYRILTGLLKTPASILGFILIALFIFIALFAPYIIPPVRANADPYTIPRDGYSSEPRPMMSAWERSAPPLPFWWKPIMHTDHWVHILGTSQGQYDIFYGIIWGTRTAFKTGLIVVIATFLIGVIIGSISAYYGGAVDNIIMRFVDVFLTLPFIMAALILAAILTPIIGQSLWPAVIALIAFGWMEYSRIIRGDILSIKERDYIMAARVIGAKDGRILFRHILPNVMYLVIIEMTLDFSALVMSETVLTYIGVGVEPGTGSWGRMIMMADRELANAIWWNLTAASAFLFVLVLAFNLFADALRDALDPRLRGDL